MWLPIGGLALLGTSLRPDSSNDWRIPGTSNGKDNRSPLACGNYLSPEGIRASLLRLTNNCGEAIP
jgi:hypothetical protein